MITSDLDKYVKIMNKFLPTWFSGFISEMIIIPVTSHSDILCTDERDKRFTVIPLQAGTEVSEIVLLFVSMGK